MNIVSFSGGKDSTAMLLMMIEKGMQIDRIINIDTTKEFPGMYDHIEQVREYIKPLEIETYEIDFYYWFSEHVRTKGKHKGVGGGYGFPDMRNRWCTGLKREAIKRAMKGLKGYNDFQGIAKDEEHRTLKNQGNNRGNAIYPLVEWGITERQALEYCYEKGFDFGGLYEHFSRVSCFCCPFSSLTELFKVWKYYPELWHEIKKMDEKSFRRFRADYTVNDLEKRFASEDKQMLLPQMEV